MILLFYILIVIGLLTVLFLVYNKISNFYYVKSLSLSQLEKELEKCNKKLEILKLEDNIDVAYAEKILDDRDMYIELIALKHKQLDIKG